MELELGLALSKHDEHAKGFAFDLNDTINSHSCTKKRGFVDTFSGNSTTTIFGGRNMAMVHSTLPTTIPLLLWCNTNTTTTTTNDENNSMNNADNLDLAAWPPTKWARRNSSINGGSKYVKVKMEGVAIGRKVDLCLHHSYHTLLQTLNLMFSRQLEKGVMQLKEKEGQPCHHRYRLTYQDGDGDWMLVGDISWESFIQSVRHLKIRINQEFRTTHEQTMQTSVTTRF